MTTNNVDSIEQRLLELVAEHPVFYYDILREFQQEDYRSIMLAFGQIRQKQMLDRDNKGRYTSKASTT